MSTLKVDGIRSNSASSDAITLASDGTCTANITNNLSNRNLIINGAMQVAQRGTSFTGTNNHWTLDRWKLYENLSTAVVDVTQETITDLVGFTKALKINTTTAETGVPTGSGNKYCTLYQGIEAQNLQHIANGASGAKSLTLSFWVKSNVTGQFCVNWYKPDNTTRIISKAYTIDSANTWEKKTITVSGDTAGGGIVNDNGGGIYIYFIWGRNTGYTGGTSTSWVNYSDSAWAPLCTGTLFENVNDHVLLTGVQLEVDNGSEKPTDFEHRLYGDELRRCQRYFFGINNAVSQIRAIGYGGGSNWANATFYFPVTMRAAPTGSGSNLGSLYFNNGTSAWSSSSLTFNTCTHSTNFGADMSGSSTGQALSIYTTGSTTKLNFDAEL